MKDLEDMTRNYGCSELEKEVHLSQEVRAKLLLEESRRKNMSQKYHYDVAIWSIIFRDLCA